MFKLTVVAGPSRGSSYTMNDGENSIGRSSGNVVVLPSSRVSKKHCVLVVDQDSLHLRDEGSANGTFVNGVLTRAREVKPGDRIGVGDFVLEIIQPQERALVSQEPAAAGFGGLLQFPSLPGGQGMAPAASHSPDGAAAGAHGIGGGDVGGAALSASATGGPMPKDLPGKALWYFENYVMPIFYGLNSKNQWRILCAGIFGVFLIANLLISVDPLMEANRGAVIAEVGRRAAFMARQIAEANGPYMAGRAETKTEIGLAENAEGVRLAVLTDLDNRIIAPNVRLNQYLVAGPESKAAARAAELFRAGRQIGVWREIDDSSWVWVEPVHVYNPATGKNPVVGMAIISMDTSLSTMQLGSLGIVYGKILIFGALLGGIALLIMYRMTLKPFQVLGEDMEKALKGDLPQVTREFRLEELDGIWDLVNSAIQRIPKANAGGVDGEEALGGISAEDYVALLKMFGDASKFGLLVVDADRKTIYLNEMFEEISGIRSHDAVGNELSSVARDAAFGPFTTDIFDRSLPGSEGVSENFDFSGIGYRVLAAALGKSGENARGYVLVVIRSEG